MEWNMEGAALKYGDNINTDIISPPQYMELSIEEAAAHAMEAIDPDFAAKASGKILVAGQNFGSGSSRETSPLTLRHLGVKAIVAQFFARIFYRNAINIGLPLIECPDVGQIEDGDELVLHLAEGKIVNNTRHATYTCDKVPEHIMQLMADGGLMAQLKKHTINNL